ncbi:ABC transporter permease [Aquamicrobium ahrensii]|uniref:Polar amino acid transport system permease protein n=1 Tax=Aquamicrobium ahrensii TaxID=469551 RepID=A0ABV2KGW6_9HYPH
MPDLQGFGYMLAEGTLITLQVALLSTVFGVAIGIAVAMMKLSSSRFARLAGDVYTTLVRGVPALVFILLIYFGGVRLVNEIGHAFGHDQHIDINAFVAGVFALSLAFGAYATEVFRGAFQSLPRGQIEAARALGMGRWLTFRRVSLPQVWRIALPGLGNIFLVILKETALVSVIGLEELMRKTEYAVGFTRQPFTFFLCAAFIYLGLTIISMLALQMMERRAARGFTPVEAA